MAVIHECTGRERYRIETRLFRDPLLVLQVEMRRHGYMVVGSFTCTSMDVDNCYWVDATVEYLSERSK